MGIIVRNRYNIVIQLCYNCHGDEQIKLRSESTRCFSPRSIRQLQYLFILKELFIM